jgi:Domain of unknown function (DUF397)
MPPSTWQKSSYSGPNGCIEVAFADGGVSIRDSKDREGPVLRFDGTEWNAFICAVRDGEFSPL